MYIFIFRLLWLWYSGISDSLVPQFKNPICAPEGYDIEIKRDHVIFLLCGVWVPSSPAPWSSDRSSEWTCPVSEHDGPGTLWRPPHSLGSKAAARWTRPGRCLTLQAGRCTKCCSFAPGHYRRFLQRGSAPMMELGSQIQAGPACPGSWHPEIEERNKNKFSRVLDSVRWKNLHLRQVWNVNNLTLTLKQF